MVQVVAALIWENGRFLACQRPAHKTRGLMWEFVGGKVEPGESREEALRRECREELNIDIEVRNIYLELDHVYPDITIHLTLFNAQIIRGKPELLEHNDLRWLFPEEIPSYSFCPADKEILEKIQSDSAKLRALRQTLYASAEAQYKAFQCSLMPTVSASRVLGVRMPILRKIAKSLAGNMQWYLSCMPLDYYEEQNIYGLLISACKDFGKTVDLLNDFLPHVDNWATCDLIVPSTFKDNPQKACRYALNWIHSEHPYTIRFGIGVLMRFGQGEYFNKSYAEAVAQVSTDEYYVKMMIAWYFATMLSGHYDAAIVYLEERILSEWIHNKAIQKGIESNRITPEQKAYLRTLRIRKKTTPVG